MRDIGVKLSAIGFIAIILSGNLWLTSYLVGKKPFYLVEVVFYTGVLTTFAGAALMGLAWVLAFLNKDG